LKQTLRILAEMPEVEDIHILGHSRGTDVALTAVRELILVERAAGRNPRQSLKLKNLILLAADMDFEVVGQRFEAEALWPAFGRVTVYATSKDSALSGSKSLFASTVRLGQMKPEDLPEYFKGALWAERNVDIIFYEGNFKGKAVSSHSYYLSPAVGADLIMTVRGKKPGAEHGRPLEVIDDHMFIIRDDYLR
jgi:esterase/lipase superfamily enzyme